MRLGCSCSRSPSGATGTVLFMQGSTVLDTGTVTNGVATLTTSSLNAGSYTIVPSPSSTQYGDPVTLTATVTSGATGTVSFYDGAVLLDTGTVANGVAATTTTLVAGTHAVTAVCNGDATYASSQSGPATVSVRFSVFAATCRRHRSI